MEQKNNLIAVDLQTKGLAQFLARAIEDGLPFLVQNIQESLDPTLEPILNKAYTKVWTLILFYVAFYATLHRALSIRPLIGRYVTLYFCYVYAVLGLSAPAQMLYWPQILPLPTRSRLE